MKTLKVSNVSKSYGDFIAVQNVSFEGSSGKILGFLGPNGAGKTTTIRMIVGITAPDSGQIEVLGEDNVHKIRNRIGYLPEERGLYKKIEIRRQLKFFASLKGVDSKTANKRIDRWLNIIKLKDWDSKKAGELSKGMQQKIQFINALLHEPDLLILDEPFSGLDPVSVADMMEIIDELKSGGKTIIFSTHQMETAEKLCDSVILINKSKRVLAGSMREVKESYGSKMLSVSLRGGDHILKNRSVVKELRTFANGFEVLLDENTSPEAFLQKLLDSKAEISRFEIKEPSLNYIFIKKVKEKDG